MGRWGGGRGVLGGSRESTTDCGGGGRGVGGVGGGGGDVEAVGGYCACSKTTETFHSSEIPVSPSTDHI